MTREMIKQVENDYWKEKADPIDMAEVFDLANKALEQERVLDKIDEIITDALDKSTDQKESQTLRWVLDKISEVT